MIQAFSTCIKPLSCDPALKCSSLQCHHASQHVCSSPQVWGIGLAGLQVWTLDLTISNLKNRFPSRTIAIFGFVSEHLQHPAGTDFGISHNLLPPLRFHTHNRDNTGLGSEGGLKQSGSSKCRNTGTTNPHPHSGRLWHPFRL